MSARIFTVALQGIEVISVDVQVQISNGLPAFTIVGLADKAIAESRERVRAAINALGLSLPPKRITINLSPAGLQKEGSHYDLPIALGVLAAMGVIPVDLMGVCTAMGELSLDGSVRSVSGVLPAAMHALAHGHTFICPDENGPEAAWADGLEVLAPAHLLQLINHMKGTQVLSVPRAVLQDGPAHLLDLQDIKGQETAKRALEVAAAGGHHLLMSGPPGSGKSMLAARLSSILPPLTPQEALEVTMIHSVAGALKKGGLVTQRPFRDPHHSATLPALVGGGSHARPGALSLAHHGVLFLDELPEFSRQTLEALRQPLETGSIHIARANAHVTYPAKVQLIAAMNPCKCGYLGDPDQGCGRAPRCGTDYQSKISGPLLDRMDLQIEVPAVPVLQLADLQPGEPSARVAQRVAAARQLQRARYQSHDLITNSQVSGQLLVEVTALDDAGQKMMVRAVEQLKLSARGYHRVLRVARTIADLAGSASVRTPHVAEALSYRGARGRL